MHGLDELWRRRIVREQGADAYDFTHGKLREVAYEGMSMAARRLAHRRVAQALERVYVARLDVVAGQIAGHYDKADLVEQAVIYYRRAQLRRPSNSLPTKRQSVTTAGRSRCWRLARWHPPPT